MPCSEAPAGGRVAKRIETTTRTRSPLVVSIRRARPAVSHPMQRRPARSPTRPPGTAALSYSSTGMPCSEAPAGGRVAKRVETTTRALPPLVVSIRRARPTVSHPMQRLSVRSPTRPPGTAALSYSSTGMPCSEAPAGGRVAKRIETTTRALPPLVVSIRRARPTVSHPMQRLSVRSPTRPPDVARRQPTGGRVAKRIETTTRTRSPLVVSIRRARPAVSHPMQRRPARSPTRPPRTGALSYSTTGDRRAAKAHRWSSSEIPPVVE